jgi:hypothetical protein
MKQINDAASMAARIVRLINDESDGTAIREPFIENAITAIAQIIRDSRPVPVSAREKAERIWNYVMDSYKNGDAPLSREIASIIGDAPGVDSGVVEAVRGDQELFPSVTAIDWVSALVSSYEEMEKACPEYEHPDPDAMIDCILQVKEFVKKARKALSTAAPCRDSIFIDHIQGHLHADEKVICKICGETAEDIIKAEGDTAAPCRCGEYRELLEGCGAHIASVGVESPQYQNYELLQKIQEVLK